MKFNKVLDNLNIYESGKPIELLVTRVWNTPKRYYKT